MSFVIWLQLAGLFVYLLGMAVMLIAAFRVNCWWGICYALIPFCVVPFSAFNWQQAKRPVLTQAAGLAILFAGLCIQTPPN